MSEIIQYWFDNRIKTDGFEGNLLVNVKQILFDREENPRLLQIFSFYIFRVYRKKILNKY